MLSEPMVSETSDDHLKKKMPLQKVRSKPHFHAFSKIAEQEWAPAILFLILDVVCWVSLYTLLISVRHDIYFSGRFEYVVVYVVQLAVLVQSLFIIGGYSARTETRGLAYTAEHVLAMLSALAVTSLILYGAATFDHTMKPGRASVLLSFIFFTAISLAYRRALRERVAAAAASRAFLVLGASAAAANFYTAYRASPNNQRLEFVDLEGTRIGDQIAGPGSPVIEGNLEEKLTHISHRYAGVILTERIDQVQPSLLDRLIRTQFQRARVYTLESFYEAHWRQVPIHWIDPFWPLQAGFQLARTSPYHYVKRIFDIFLSGLLLVVCLPLMAALACLIWLTSGRPVIFKQPRVGRDEAIFTACKFRTMRTEQGAGGTEQGVEVREEDINEAEIGEQRAGSTEQGASRSQRSAAYAQGSGVPGRSEVREADLYTRENDPRILPVGRWLRKLRLDELPQLWNVFHGELSLIGPRAEWIECAERYEKKIPFYHFRHLVKPGITGWAQVNYPYGESEEDAIEKLKYDLYYIRHYSLKLDAMIVLKTIHIMFAGKGR
jgi:exopolysaccharide biosynthesis polyprenyl glycosylphosphotransferase